MRRKDVAEQQRTKRVQRVLSPAAASGSWKQKKKKRKRRTRTFKFSGFRRKNKSGNLYNHDQISLDRWQLWLFIYLFDPIFPFLNIIRSNVRSELEFCFATVIKIIFLFNKSQLKLLSSVLIVSIISHFWFLPSFFHHLLSILLLDVILDSLRSIKCLLSHWNKAATMRQSKRRTSTEQRNIFP